MCKNSKFERRDQKNGHRHSSMESAKRKLFHCKWDGNASCELFCSGCQLDSMVLKAAHKNNMEIHKTIAAAALSGGLTLSNHVEKLKPFPECINVFFTEHASHGSGVGLITF